MTPSELCGKNKVNDAQLTELLVRMHFLICIVKYVCTWIFVSACTFNLEKAKGRVGKFCGYEATLKTNDFINHPPFTMIHHCEWWVVYEVCIETTQRISADFA